MNIGYMLGAIANVDYEITRWLSPLLMILMAVIGIAAVVCILMQKGTNDNIGSLGGSETDTSPARTSRGAKRAFSKSSP